MTLYDFNDKGEMEQIEAVWEGAFIATRKDKEHNILLYQIDSFYVEVFYNQKHKFIRKLRSFSSTSQLEPYLEKINIVKLIKGKV